MSRASRAGAALGIVGRNRAARRVRDRRDAIQDGKHPRERCHLTRENGVHSLFRQTKKMLAQPIHQVVERLEGYRFAFIASSGERDGVVPQADVVEKPLKQGALANARPALDEYDDRPALLHRCERVGQCILMLAAANETPAERFLMQHATAHDFLVAAESS
jgi:hypothetical protein